MHRRVQILLGAGYRFRDGSCSNSKCICVTWFVRMCMLFFFHCSLQAAKQFRVRQRTLTPRLNLRLFPSVLLLMKMLDLAACIHQGKYGLICRMHVQQEIYKAKFVMF